MASTRLPAVQGLSTSCGLLEALSSGLSLLLPMGSSFSPGGFEEQETGCEGGRGGPPHRLWPGGRGRREAPPGTLGPAICQAESLPALCPNPDTAGHHSRGSVLAGPTAERPCPPPCSSLRARAPGAALPAWPLRPAQAPTPMPRAHAACPHRAALIHRLPPHLGGISWGSRHRGAAGWLCWRRSLGGFIREMGVLCSAHTHGRAGEGPHCPLPRGSLPGDWPPALAATCSRP